jgi:hypothetical protein
LFLFYLGSGEPYVHEFKEFAGVTIIFRTATNQRALGTYDGHGKNGMQGARRKSEFQHSQLNMQDKSDHGDKTDHTGIRKKLNKISPSQCQIFKSYENLM